MKASTFLVIATVLLAPAAFAGDANVLCKTATTAIEELKGEREIERLTKRVGNVSMSHQVKIRNGWAQYGESALVFDKRPEAERLKGPAEPIIVPWGKGDLLSAKSPESDEQKAKGELNDMKLFLQMAGQQDFNGPNDVDTQSGIHKVTNYDSIGGVLCSSRKADYSFHWFPATDEEKLKVGDSYCVRTRDGKNYALITVDASCEDGLVFSYRYNGESPKFSADLQEVDGKTQLRPKVRRLM